MKYKFIICSSLMILLLVGCSTSIDLNSYQEKAWESLTAKEKQTVTHHPSEAVVTMDAVYRKFEGDAFEHIKEIPAISVRFNTTDDALLGPIEVYIDKERGKILGQKIRL